MTTHRKLKAQRKLKLLVQSISHLFATSLIYGGLLMWFVNERAVNVFAVAVGDEAMRGDLFAPLAILAGLAMCIWGLTFITFSLFKDRVEQARNPMVLKTSTGTILTETLIVMPIFLLLTFGTLQMTINSIAGLLGTLGTFEAGRTLAVWAPEVGNDRGMGTVTEEDAKNAARLAAAGVIAPVVPVSATALAVCGVNTNVERIILGMLTAGVAPAGAASGSIGNLIEAIDGTSSFGARGANKLRLAYCAGSVDYTTVVTETTSRDRNQFTVTYTYRHPNVMPLVGPVFRSGAPGAPWATLDVSAVTREYTTTQQITPNIEIPTGGVIQNLLSGLFSNPI